MASERVGYQIAAGIERDTQQSVTPYAGNSSIYGLSAFALSLDSMAHRVRANGLLGLFYEVEKTKRLSANISFRNQTYSSLTAFSATAGYQVAF
jgi:hypothetical protein